MGSRDEAFEDFVHTNLDALYGHARFLTNSDHDAWDLVQEALARMGTRWRRIDQRDNPLGYARQVIARLAVDRLRLRARERATDIVPDRPTTPPAPAGVDPWLADALRTLPPRQRTALVLRFVDDLDFAGIAATMGGSVSTAKSQVSRGLARLREAAPRASERSSIPEDDHV